MTGTVATAKRDERIRTIRRQLEQMSADINRPTIDVNGMQSAYLANRKDHLLKERSRLEGESERLANMSNDEAVSEFMPDVAQTASNPDLSQVQFTDTLAHRGAMMPRQVVIQSSPPPVRREGGDPAIPWTNTAGGPPGWKPGETYVYPKSDS